MQRRVRRARLKGLARYDATSGNERTESEYRDGALSAAPSGCVHYVTGVKIANWITSSGVVALSISIAFRKFFASSNDSAMMRAFSFRATCWVSLHSAPVMVAVQQMFCDDQQER